MIYLFDRDKVVKRGIHYADFTTVSSKEPINGLIDITLEIGIQAILTGDTSSSNIKEIFKDVEFVGYIDENKEFQLFRIVKPTVENNKLSFYGIHIFFDESQSKAIINDRRWRDAQGWLVLRDAYAYIGWVLTDYESGKILDHNAFRQSPAQVRAEVIERYQVEIEPYLEFDGKKITRKCFRVKNALGSETHDRFDYGSNLLKIIFEEDLGDIYTAVIGRGKGEESVANSKIEFDDIAWSVANGDPVDKPLGQNYVELPNATQKYGYVEDGLVSPRLIMMDFDDIEDKALLLQESYDWIVANSLPKTLIEADVFSIGTYELGDVIGIVYKQAGVVRKMRIHEITHNLKRPKLSKFKIGDYDHFIKNTVTRQYRKKLNKLEDSTNVSLENLNTNFNDKMAYEVDLLEKQAEAVKTEANANIVAMETSLKDEWAVRDTEINESIRTIIGGDISSLGTNIIELQGELQGKLETGTFTNFKTTQDGFNASVTELDNWKAEKGALFDVTAEKVRTSVWQSDIDAVDMGTENLFPNADIENWKSVAVPDEWSTGWGAGAVFSGRQNGKHILVRANNEVVNDGTSFGVESPILTRDVIEGEEYTLSFNSFDWGNFVYDYMYLMNVDGTSNQSLDTPQHDGFVYKWQEANTGKNVERLVLKIIPNFSGRARILFARRIEVGSVSTFYINEPQFVKGNKAPTSFSPSPLDFLQQTDFILQSDGFLLGTTKVGGQDFAQAIVGNNNAINLIGDNVNVSNNLNVKNSVTAWSLDVIKANIGTLFAETAFVRFIKAKHVEFDTAFINDIIGKNAFIDNATIKAGNIRDLTANEIRGGVLRGINDNMQIDLLNNEIDFYSDSSIVFHSSKNEFKMLYPSSVTDNREVIVGFGTSQSSSGVNLAYFGGGHYDIDGHVKPNGTGYAGLTIGGGSNNSRLTGTQVEVGSGNATDDLHFMFDFNKSSRYAHFRPPTSADNFVLGSSLTPFHSIFTWRINGLRFNDLTGHTELNYDNGGTNGAGFRFTETDVYFSRGGLFSIKGAITNANSAYNSIEADNGLKAQIRDLAFRISQLE